MISRSVTLNCGLSIRISIIISIQKPNLAGILVCIIVIAVLPGTAIGFCKEIVTICICALCRRLFTRTIIIIYKCITIIIYIIIAIFNSTWINIFIVVITITGHGNKFRRNIISSTWRILRNLACTIRKTITISVFVPDDIDIRRA